MAIGQIDQLSMTVKHMNETILTVQAEKNQLASKVAGLEQIVLQLSMF